MQERLVEAAEAGIRWVQLRDHDLGKDEFRRVASDVIFRLREVAPEVLITINARLEVARKLGVGFHTGVRGPSIADAIRAGVSGPVGYSVHSEREARAVARQYPDYLIFSPVFATTSKPDATPAGLGALVAVVGAVSPLPVIALGGVEAVNAASCMRAGAAGIAVLSAILDADDVGEAVGELLKQNG